MYIAKSTCIWNFKRERKIEVKYSLEEFDVMVILTFVDLQRFVVNKKFIVNEVAVLKQRTVLTYTFYESCPWKFLTRFDRFYASWLSAYHHGWEDGMILYSEAKCLFTVTVFEDVIVFVKGHKKRMWL